MEGMKHRLIPAQAPARNVAPTVAIAFALAFVLAPAAWAGRPLAVDDANVNDTGSGHIEMFYQRAPGEVHSFTIAPAVGIADGWELAAAFSRDHSAAVSTSGMQVKWRITPSRKDGCNTGASLGAAQPNTGVVASVFVNGLFSCNFEPMALHLNLGALRVAGNTTLGTWGLAVEREIGRFTGHAELFGQEQAQPTLQLSLRTLLSKQWQIDGTVGHSGGEHSYSVGLKFMF
jgi:hypothetical protein